ncbi:MAG: glycerophosphodiester phosphodiesterase family protein [Pseudomonadota bacterium]
MKPELHDAFLRCPLAHRALHDVVQGRPENSMAAIRAACAAGYGIEIDVQRSADGEAMVFHDDDLGRLTRETGDIHLRAAQDLKAINLRGGDEGIPTLADVLDLVAGRVPLLIEVKDQDGAMGTSVGLLEQRVAETLAGYHGPVAVMSFNPHSVRKMAAYGPGIARGLVTGAPEVRSWGLPPEETERLSCIADFDPAACSFISHEVDDLTNPRVAALKQQGAPILCWTVKSAEQEAQARQIADNITFEQYLAPFPA